MRSPKSFTLIELLVVIAILAILVLLLQPSTPPYDHPLHTALRNGDLLEAERLIDNRLASVNEQGYKGWRPLHYAAMGDYRDFAEKLIEMGADVNGRDTWGSTPLHCACMWAKVVAQYGIERTTKIDWSPDVAELLIEKGADVNAKDHRLRTPLHDAATFSCVDLAKLLLANGADVNAKDHCLETPLHIAASAGSSELVALLLAKGADMNAKCTGGDTPLSCADRAGNRDITALLIAKGAIRTSARNDRQ